MCLAEFSSRFLMLSKSHKPKSSPTVFELQNNLGHIKTRKADKEAVIRYPKFNVEKNPEDFYLSMALGHH